MRARTLAPRRGTRLPNAHIFAYGKYVAFPGDYVMVTSNGRDAFGRVLGQITSTDSDGQDCRGWLAVAVVSDDLTFGYERWIAPGDVSSCVPAKHVNAFMSAFLNATVAETLAGLAANNSTLAANKAGRIWTEVD